VYFYTCSKVALQYTLYLLLLFPYDYNYYRGVEKREPLPYILLTREQDEPSFLFTRMASLTN